MDSLLRAARLAAFPLARATGYPKPLPANLTVSVIYNCPSRCGTCDIWKKRADNLRLDEYEKVFRSLGGAVAWVTLSGGDQFLRADLPDIVRLVREVLRPRVINIPMNGILTRRIETLLPEIARNSRGSPLVLNFSIDDIGERHDQLRGFPGNWQRVLTAYRFAKELQRSERHLSVGIHTVISRSNVERIPEIYDALIQFEPDAYLTEIAEQRVELGTMDKAITPDPEAYSRAARALQQRMRRRRSRHPVGRLVEALRLEYYDLVQAILRERRQVIPCYAGWASAQLAPDGEVWGCCVRAESLGNVRATGYDFGRVWRSKRADEFRRSVRAGECACPLANAAYTNMMFSPRSLARVAANFAGRSRA